jgi:hypothetical protein
MLDNNPLKQYFRRPALYVKLPSEGKYYNANIVDMPENGELPVYPMTAIDEITSKTPDALYNGMAIVEIIKSCIPCIKDPWQISSMDLDALLIAIRMATNGNEMDLESTCPSCTEENKYGLNLSLILGSLKPGDYTAELKVDGLSIKYRPLTYKEANQGNTAQIEMQRVLNNLATLQDEDQRTKASSDGLKKISKISMEIVANTVESITLPDGVKVEDKKYILEFLTNCDKKTYAAVRDFSVKLRESTEIKPLHFKCADCGHEYDQPFTLNISDFFE